MGWAPQAGLRVGSRPLILPGPVGHRPPSRALAETLHGDIANLRASRGQVRPRGAGRHSRPPVGGNAEPRVKGEGDLGVGGQTTTASSGFPVCFRDKLQSPRGGQQSLGPSYPDTLPAPGPIPPRLHDAAKGDFAPRPAGQGSFRDISPADWSIRIGFRGGRLGWASGGTESARLWRKEGSTETTWTLSPSPPGAVDAMKVCVANTPGHRTSSSHRACALAVRLGTAWRPSGSAGLTLCPLSAVDRGGGRKGCADLALPLPSPDLGWHTSSRLCPTTHQSPRAAGVPPCCFSGDIKLTRVTEPARGPRFPHADDRGVGGGPSHREPSLSPAVTDEGLETKSRQRSGSDSTAQAGWRCTRRPGALRRPPSCSEGSRGRGEASLCRLGGGLARRALPRDLREWRGAESRTASPRAEHAIVCTGRPPLAPHLPPPHAPGLNVSLVLNEVVFSSCTGALHLLL